MLATGRTLKVAKEQVSAAEADPHKTTLFRHKESVAAISEGYWGGCFFLGRGASSPPLSPRTAAAAVGFVDRLTCRGGWIIHLRT